MEKRSNTVDRTNETIFNLEFLVSTMKDAEAEVRGYILTRNPQMVKTYSKIDNKLDSVYKKIKTSISSDSLQQIRLELVKAHIKDKLRVLNRALSAAIQNPDLEARIFVNSEFPDTLIMNTIKKNIKVMQDHEKFKLKERVDKYNETYASLRITNFAALFIAIILAVFSLIAFERENKTKKIYRAELEIGIEKLKAANKELLELKSIEKFAISGRISRTLAHEIRNPLTSISLAVDQLKDTLTADEDNTFLLDIIRRNSDRINLLISKLLNSTKFSELQVSAVSPGELIDEALELAADRINLQDIKIIKNYSYLHEKIEVDVEKMRIAILNIIVNALEAMEPGKGVLEVKTENREGKCMITIKDNGIGLDKDAVSKIFEPYYTTKDAGNGLGLTNTQNIVLNHNGNIHMESELGKGTVFYIYLNSKISTVSVEKNEQFS